MRSSLGITLIAWTSIGPALADEPQPRIRFTIANIRGTSGVVRCSLYRSADGYPKEPEKAVAQTSSSIRDGQSVCEFTNVGTGNYAIAGFHDENNDGKMDRNFIGIPTEGVVASRDAKGTMGPPKFKDAQFDYGGGVLELKARMRY